MGKRVDVISKTHAACANFGYGADTVDHWTHKYIKCGSCAADLVIVEELTQCNAYLWDELAKLSLKGIPFILLGDFAQYEAIMDSISGCFVKPGSLQRSDLIRSLAGCTRMTISAATHRCSIGTVASKWESRARGPCRKPWRRRGSCSR